MPKSWAKMGYAAVGVAPRGKLRSNRHYNPGYPGLLVNNIVGASRAAVVYGLPIIHSTVNVKTGLNKPPIPQIRKALADYPTYDRTSINSWEDVEFRKAVEETGRKKLIMTALWTEACLTFPALDALREGYEVYVVADAVGGTSVAAHEAALRRIEQAGGKLISVPQLFCELQRDWKRAETVPAFMNLFIETGGTAGIQFSYDRTEGGEKVEPAATDKAASEGVHAE